MRTARTVDGHHCAPPWAVDVWLAPLAADLLEWRISRGKPADDSLVFPARGGAVWVDDAWRYWRRRIFTPAAKAAGLDSPVRPYELRHSFVSLLLAEGANVVEIARQAGHSPTMTLSTYAHLFDEAPGAERTSAEDEIRRARQLVRRERRTRSITRVDQVSSQDAQSRAKAHGSEECARRRWRPKTSDDKGVDPA
jgi:hypothetical protein